MELSKSLQSIIFNLNEENIKSSVQSTIELFTYNKQYTFNLLISRIIYTAFVSQVKVKSPIFKYLVMLNLQEEKTNKNIINLIYIFNQYLLQIKTQESLFLLRKMNEQGLFETNLVKYNKKNYELVLNNDFANLKNINEEGHNPNEIAKIIRNDEMDKLQEISSQENFDFNQTIEPSLYERCSFINEENVTLIDYAAFFGSVKCFKYLLMNGAEVENTGKYAVAGGSLEIIHLCEQNHSSFKDAYETAIKFHQNDIFIYLYEKKNDKIITKYNKQTPNLNHRKAEKDIAYFKRICLVCDNYIIFSFLEQETMEITEGIIEEIARNGNTFIMENIIDNQQIPNTILSCSVESGNIEIVKLLLDKGIDVNAKTIHLNNLKYVLIILDMF